MRAFHCSWALALVLTAATAAQQAPAAPGPALATTPPTTGYTIFMRGTPIGREEMSVEVNATGTTVVSSGRLSAPLNVVLRRAEFKYRPDGAPALVFLDMSSNGAEATLRTTFADLTASTEISQGVQTTKIAHQVTAQTIPLPNNVFSAYAVVAQRLAAAVVGSQLRAYVVPSGEVGITVKEITAERMQIGATFVNVRRYELAIANAGGDLAVSLTADERGSLVRIGVVAAGIDVIREDLAASTSRLQLYSNAGDEPVIIPAVGFNLGATLTRPRSAGTRSGGPSAPPSPPIARLPAVILLSGSGVADRDGFVAGIPTLGQLAGAVADAGFIAVRYDKRGFGQSGGRAESATLQDYSDDARAVVKWLQARKDVDPKRIAVIGHSEGAWVAIQAAARDNKIAALVSIAGPATAGADVILEQQLQALDLLKLPSAEREQRIALQKQIQAAVLTGKGWEAIPPALRKQADTPWLQSFLAFTPATVVDDVRQPILFVHGELDRQVPVAHVTQLSELARKGKSRSIEVVVVRGVNHLLVPATTGEIAEYTSLPDRNVSADVRSSVTGWLTRTFAAIK
jgi:dipeptidyl aminopeptidase/acylaminoacyl peptidase